ncbi:hypothetical protein [Streptomyces sp. NPDC060022]|uniref:hypothetical protein n=1 Tax=Streptomyces sp. NPDC060022 TaxID=3347039 RepID=UPI00368F1F40
MTATAPAVEIHTLLHHDHVSRYLFALRSLTRFWDPPAVVVHDDGTLRADDTALLTAAQPRLRVIGRDEADGRVERELKDFPLLRRVRAGNPRLLQLVDYYLLADAPRVIAMDSDVVFMRRPDAVIDWAGEGGFTVGYSPEYGWEPKGMHWLPDALPGEPYIADMCCGFVCAEKDAFFAPGELERIASGIDHGILFRPRFVTQMLYSLLAGRLRSSTVRSFGEPYRSGRLEWLPDEPDRVLCHYFGSHDSDDALADLVARDPGLTGLAEKWPYAR